MEFECITGKSCQNPQKNQKRLKGALTFSGLRKQVLSAYPVSTLILIFKVHSLQTEYFLENTSI